MGKFAKFWFPVIGYSAIIFVISGKQTAGPGFYFPGIDKIFHLVEYTPFGFLIFRALKGYQTSSSDTKILVWTVILTLCYGITDEIHQHFVPNRQADVLDVLADTVGGLIGGLLFMKIKTRKSE